MFIEPESKLINQAPLGAECDAAGISLLRSEGHEKERVSINIASLTGRSIGGVLSKTGGVIDGTHDSGLPIPGI